MRFRKEKPTPRETLSQEKGHNYVTAEKEVKVNPSTKTQQETFTEETEERTSK
jgi:hypothetical protein